MTGSGQPLTTGVMHFTDARPGGMFKMDLSGTLQIGDRSVPLSGQWSESSHYISFFDAGRQLLFGYMAQTDGNLIGGTWGDGRNIWIAQRIE